jgi:hypothetical protein
MASHADFGMAGRMDPGTSSAQGSISHARPRAEVPAGLGMALLFRVASG